jgi:hypothetical protein
MATANSTIDARDLVHEAHLNLEARRQASRIQIAEAYATETERVLQFGSWLRQDRGSVVSYALLADHTLTRCAVVMRDRLTNAMSVAWNETEFSDFALMDACRVSRETGRSRAHVGDSPIS